MAQSKKSKSTTQHHYGNDEITLNWSIPSFKKLYDAAESAKNEKILEEEFTAGGKNWGFQLRQETKEDVEIYLFFYGSDFASADYTVYLKSSEGQFINTGYIGLHKYAPKDANIEGATLNWGPKRWKTLTQLQNEGFLSDGTLQLKLVMTVYSGNALLRMEASEDFMDGLESGLGSDVTFIFVEEEGSENVIDQIKAHKTILSLRSSVFAAMFASGMKEATEGEVKISDMTPNSFRILLNFIYSGEVDGEWKSFAAELIYAADKYDLKVLKKYLCENIASVLNVKNVWKIRRVASIHKLPQILKATMKFIKENTQDLVDNVQEVILKEN